MVERARLFLPDDSGSDSSSSSDDDVENTQPTINCDNYADDIDVERIRKLKNYGCGCKLNCP